MSLFFQALDVLSTDLFFGHCCIGGGEEIGKFIPICSSVEAVFLMQNKHHKVLTSVRSLLFLFRAQLLMEIGLRKLCFRVKAWWQIPLAWLRCL